MRAHGKLDILILSQNAAILAGAILSSKVVCYEILAHNLAEEMEKVTQAFLRACVLNESQ